MSCRTLPRRLLPSLLASCWGLSVALGAAAETVSRRVFVMGTWLEIEVEAADEWMARELSSHALAAIRAAESRLSTWRSDSELATLNRQPVGVWMPISPALAADLETALEWSRRTDGAFQPMMGPLVAAWDLRGNGRVPDPRELGAAVAACRADSFELDGLAARRLSPGAAVEEGGFGKGAALRDAAAAFGTISGACLSLNFGGQIMRSGECAASSVDLAHPADRGRSIAQLTLGEGSVASSGQSERRVEVDGHRFGHILDPLNGRPVAAWGSVSVLHGDPVAADCLATALFVMGPAGAAAWLQAHPEVAAVLTIPETWGTTLKVSPGMAGRIRALASTTRLAPLVTRNPAGSPGRPHTTTPDPYVRFRKDHRCASSRP